jgi:hypothetical protein
MTGAFLEVWRGRTRMKMEQEFDQLVSEHIDGKPTVHSTQRLDEILRKNPRLRKEMLDQMCIHSLLSECFRPGPGDTAVPRDTPLQTPPPSALRRLLGSFARLFRPGRCRC